MMLTPQRRISILVSGCYAAWKWKRLAQYDEYHHPGNVKPFGFNAELKHKKGFSSHTLMLSDDLDWDPDLDMGNNVEIVSGGASPRIMAPSPGETTPMTPGFAKGTTGRMNFSMTSDVDAVNAEAGAGRARADTASSLMALDTAYDPAAAAAASIAVPQRPVSYSHVRDPAFDDYVRQQKHHQRRASQRISSGSSASWTSNTSSSAGRDSAGSPPATSTAGSSRVPSGSASASATALYRLSLNLKSDVDDALGAEFGWGAASRSSSQDSIMAGGDPPAIAVGGGVVTSAKNVRDSLGRAPSDGSERGALGSVRENGEVEEDEEEEEGVEDGDRRRRNLDDASRALLGEGREDGGHPDLLRPGRPKSEIEFVITPPPRSPGPNSRSTWGSAYSR